MVEQDAKMSSFLISSEITEGSACKLCKEIMCIYERPIEEYDPSFTMETAYWLFKSPLRC